MTHDIEFCGILCRPATAFRSGAFQIDRVDGDPDNDPHPEPPGSEGAQGGGEVEGGEGDQPRPQYHIPNKYINLFSTNPVHKHQIKCHWKVL